MKVYGDLFSEAVSKEQGLIPETHTHRGRENRTLAELMGKWHFCVRG